MSKQPIHVIFRISKKHWTSAKISFSIFIPSTRLSKPFKQSKLAAFFERNSILFLFWEWWQARYQGFIIDFHLKDRKDTIHLLLDLSFNSNLCLEKRRNDHQTVQIRDCKQFLLLLTYSEGRKLWFTGCSHIEHHLRLVLILCLKHIVSKETFSRHCNDLFWNFLSVLKSQTILFFLSC